MRHFILYEWSDHPRCQDPPIFQYKTVDSSVPGSRRRPTPPQNRSPRAQMLDAAAYEENHNFAVAFTIIAAASQGFGGLLAVLGMGQFGSSVAHLMSFSTGVMIYLSFMDIMVETKEKIGETYAGLAFFAGIGLFLLLEVCLPEVDGSQVACLGRGGGGGHGSRPLTPTLKLTLTRWPTCSGCPGHRPRPRSNRPRTHRRAAAAARSL